MNTKENREHIENAHRKAGLAAVNKNACDKWRKAHSLQVSDYAHEYYMKRKGRTNDESGIQAVDKLQRLPA